MFRFRFVGFTYSHMRGFMCTRTLHHPCALQETKKESLFASLGHTYTHTCIHARRSYMHTHIKTYRSAYMHTCMCTNKAPHQTSTYLTHLPVRHFTNTFPGRRSNNGFRSFPGRACISAQRPCGCLRRRSNNLVTNRFPACSRPFLRVNHLQVRELPGLRSACPEFDRAPMRHVRFCVVVARRLRDEDACFHDVVWARSRAPR